MSINIGLLLLLFGNRPLVEPTSSTNTTESKLVNYTAHAVVAIETLQQWYNQRSGLWDTTGWWNSANALTMLADFTTLDPALNDTIQNVIENTFVQAQQTNSQIVKFMTPHSVESYCSQQLSVGLGRNPNFQNRGFLNQYYDDEGWWALAWLRVYDNTHQLKYLNAAQDIFEDMKTGWGATCGGLWWDKIHSYSGAVENELFLSVAAQLANRVSANQDYRDWALKIWHWFENSGMINEQNTINNGLDLSTCRNDNGTVWTYNQGIILGGLLELYEVNPNISYLVAATKIASAGIESLSDSNGILHEPCEPDCGADGPQFKGIFMRNLQKLQMAFPSRHFRSFIRKNASSIWSQDRNTYNELGLTWSGPFNGATASTQSSACDALVAAVGVANSSS